MASSKRLFAGRLFAGRLFAPSLFRGVGEDAADPPTVNICLTVEICTALEFTADICTALAFDAPICCGLDLPANVGGLC